MYVYIYVHVHDVNGFAGISAEHIYIYYICWFINSSECNQPMKLIN